MRNAPKQRSQTRVPCATIALESSKELMARRSPTSLDSGDPSFVNICVYTEATAVETTTKKNCLKIQKGSQGHLWALILASLWDACQIRFSFHKKVLGPCITYLRPNSSQVWASIAKVIQSYLLLLRTFENILPMSSSHLSFGCAHFRLP